MRIGLVVFETLSSEYSTYLGRQEKHLKHRGVPTSDAFCDEP